MTIDVNVWLDRWPFRRLSGDEPSELVKTLEEGKISQAWVGSFDAVLHRDLGAVNRRLAETCRVSGKGLLIPMGTVNPLLPDWQEELRRCHEDHRMPGLRVLPQYHGYRLEHPQFLSLVRMATARRLLVQIPVKLEDERTQHPLVRVPPVDLTPLPRLFEAAPGLRVLILNGAGTWNATQLRTWIATGEVFFDLAMVEGVGGVANLLEKIPRERVLFGSHAPFFYHVAANLKMQEAGLKPDQEHAIRLGNARRLLPA